MPTTARWAKTYLKRNAFVLLCAAMGGSFSAHAQAERQTGRDGVVLKCGKQAADLEAAQRAMSAYLLELRIPEGLLTIDPGPAASQITYRLRTAENDRSTLDLLNRPEYWVSEERVLLPGGRSVSTVSEKEIVLALMQRGRVTVFEGPECGVLSLRQHVGVRRNIVAWAERLEWGWPEGTGAKWNTALWRKGTPLSPSKPGPPLMDAFLRQSHYAVGCYTAAKMVVAHGVLDYYRRVRKDKGTTGAIEAVLNRDGDPLVDIEPPEMWEFEDSFDEADRGTPGKLLELQRDVAPKNLVPGDWVYFLNTDPTTYAKTGYEGSNSIYLGRGRFSDYYNDNEHFYTWEQKLDEVFQWRNGVFSRSRHFKQAVALSKNELERLGEEPAKGGLLLSIRAVPVRFENLPRTAVTLSKGKGSQALAGNMLRGSERTGLPNGLASAMHDGQAFREDAPIAMTEKADAL